MKHKDCPMCGKVTVQVFGKWYYYANGQQTLEYVCEQCAELHDRLVKEVA